MLKAVLLVCQVARVTKHNLIEKVLSMCTRVSARKFLRHVGRGGSNFFS